MALKLHQLFKWRGTNFFLHASIGVEFARCNNSQIKILNVFQFPHVLTA